MSGNKDWQQLVDRQAISDLIYRYCRSVDRLDEALGHSIWHEGSVADYGDFYQGAGPGVIDLICAQHRHLLYHSHQIGNILIQLEGDKAGSESYVTANLRMQQGDEFKQMTTWTRYVDQWSQRDGCWGLDKRTAIIDFDEIREVTPLSGFESQGARDKSDPSYRVLTQLPTNT